MGESSWIGQSFVDAIGCHWSEPPLAELLATLGVSTAEEVANPVDEQGIDLHFTDGRLTCVGFMMGVFEGELPQGLSWEDPLPADAVEGLTSAKGPRSATIVRDGHAYQFLLDHGYRFHLSVTKAEEPVRETFSPLAASQRG